MNSPKWQRKKFKVALMSKMKWMKQKKKVEKSKCRRVKEGTVGNCADRHEPRKEEGKLNLIQKRNDWRTIFIVWKMKTSMKKKKRYWSFTLIEEFDDLKSNQIRESLNFTEYHKNS